MNFLSAVIFALARARLILQSDTQQCAITAVNDALDSDCALTINGTDCCALAKSLSEKLNATNEALKGVLCTDNDGCTKGDTLGVDESTGLLACSPGPTNTICTDEAPAGSGTPTCVDVAGPGEDFQCACGIGYRGASVTNGAASCVDIDECAEGSHACVKGWIGVLPGGL